MIINETPMAKGNAVISHKSAELSQQVFGQLLIVSVCTIFFFFSFSSLSQVALAQATLPMGLIFEEIWLQTFDGQSVIFADFFVLFCFFSWGQVGPGIS